MATGVNKVILIGNLGRDPEIQNLADNLKKASFSLATTEVYRNNKGERVQHTEWHNIVLWRNLAEIAEQYLRKGSQVYLEGRLRTRQWDDKDGNKRYTTEILVDNMTMLGARRDSQAPETPDSNGSPKLAEADVAEEPDDLPF